MYMHACYILPFNFFLSGRVFFQRIMSEKSEERTSKISSAKERELRVDDKEMAERFDFEMNSALFWVLVFRDVWIFIFCLLDIQHLYTHLIRNLKQRNGSFKTRRLQLETMKTRVKLQNLRNESFWSRRVERKRWPVCASSFMHFTAVTVRFVRALLQYYCSCRCWRSFVQW